MQDNVYRWNPNFDKGLFEIGVKNIHAILDLFINAESDNLEEMTICRAAILAKEILREKIELNLVPTGIC